MKRLIEALRSARKTEILLIAAMLGVLLLLCMGNDAPNSAFEGDETEMRMQQVLSRIQGAGKVSVMLAKDAQQQLTGAVVVSPGADDVKTMLEIQRAVQALTGLELERIEIVKSGG